MVPSAPAGVQDRWVDALPAVNDAEPELSWVIVDFHVDPLRLGVPERITQRLAMG